VQVESKIFAQLAGGLDADASFAIHEAVDHALADAAALGNTVLRFATISVADMADVSMSMSTFGADKWQAPPICYYA
jgi:hypothetical protein